MTTKMKGTLCENAPGFPQFIEYLYGTKSEFCAIFSENSEEFVNISV